MKSKILSIESSCDDTSAAILDGLVVKSNVVSSQEVHGKYGGVVPEVASREHSIHIGHVVEAALEKSGTRLRDLDAIACTRGPGLLGSLLVGFTFARSLAYALQVPLIDVHHMQAHVLAHYLEKVPPSTPYLCLTVSGGHTQIIKVYNPLKMEILGSTRDDAAGEAFDKGGKLLGLSYPAGPTIDKLATEGNPRFSLPHPDIPDLDYSFSGLKTAFLYLLRKQLANDPNFITNNLKDLCASLQKTIVDVLLDKVIKAAKEHHIQHIAIAGGVAANGGLRRAISSIGESLGWTVHLPRMAYCTDNAAMIGAAAYFKHKAGIYCPSTAKPDARLVWNPEIK